MHRKNGSTLCCLEQSKIALSRINAQLLVHSQKKITNYSPANQNRLIIRNCRPTILSTLFSHYPLPQPFVKHSRNIYPYLPHFFFFFLKSDILFFISFHIRHVRALKKKKVSTFPSISKCYSNQPHLPLRKRHFSFTFLSISRSPVVV